ncbi:MAG TPA: SDR family oxidoreductase [Pedobacter sp.]|jgi:L-fucose dehydrogenase
MDLNLQDKVVIVTGGAKGIGRGIVDVLAREGAIAAIVGRGKDDNDRAVKNVIEKGGNAFGVQAELSNPAEVKRAVQEVAEKYGRIEGLINNAGVNDGIGLEDGSYEKFMASLHKNLVHYYLMAQECLPFLKESKGAIVNIGSKTADTGQGNTSAYAAANGGRNALTREWAIELGKYDIRVNAVIVAECYTPMYDAWVKTLENPQQRLKEITDLIPYQKRMTTADEIANMTVFLLSEKSSHTTGQLIYVDGGYTHLDRAIR